MSKFYSILLDDEMHDDLKRLSYETGEHISGIVRKGIKTVLAENGKCEDKTQGGNEWKR